MSCAFNDCFPLLPSPVFVMSSCLDKDVVSMVMSDPKLRDWGDRPRAWTVWLLQDL